MSSTNEDGWQIDEQGRRFREVGDIREYYPTIRVHGVEVEYDPEKGVMGRARFVDATKKKKEIPCPFRGKCRTDCARYTADGCGLATGAAPTVKMKCPLGSKTNAFLCQEDCALWNLCNAKNSNSGGNTDE